MKKGNYTFIVDMLVTMAAAILFIGMQLVVYDNFQGVSYGGTSGCKSKMTELEKEKKALEKLIQDLERLLQEERNKTHRKKEEVLKGRRNIELLKKKLAALDKKLEDAIKRKRDFGTQSSTGNGGEAERAPKRAALVEDAPGKNSIFAVIWENELLPLDQEHYHCEYSPGILDIWPSRTICKKVTKGEEIREMSTPGSAFMNFLHSHDPAKVYLTLLIDRHSSLKLFRQARSLAMRNGFAVAWEPSLRPLNEIVFSERGGRVPKPVSPQQR